MSTLNTESKITEGYVNDAVSLLKRLIATPRVSRDETAAAVVKNGRDVLSNVISSQIALHTLYGGVVPEIASRKHIEKINQVIEQALSDADCTLDDLDAIGVTYGPGLVGALLVGVAEAKAIAYARHLPLVGVHHIEGHVYKEDVPGSVTLPLKMHIGAPCVPVIQDGARVTAGQLIAACPEGAMGTNLHASITGTAHVGPDAIRIEVN